MQSLTIKKKLENACTVLTAFDFAVGDRVRHRTWSIESNSSPIIEKRWLIITSISEDWPGIVSIRCGSREFEAFELVKA